MAYIIRNEPGNWRIYEAENLSDIVEYLETTPRDPQSGRSSIEPRLDDWGGTRTFEDAIHFARNGWPKGRDLLTTGLDGAGFVKKPTLHRCQAFDVAGAYPMVARAVAGDPLCMVTTGLEVSRTRPVIRFLVNVGGLGNINGETMIRRGAAILSWVDHLEQGDMRCEVVCIQANNARQLNPSKTNNIFFAKRADEPVDIDRCAFLLANPAVFRRFIFGAWERDPSLRNMTHTSYGSSCDDIHPSVQVPHSVYFPKPTGNSEWATPQLAVARITDIITRAISLETFDQEAA